MRRILAADLFQGDGNGNWVHEFRYRGREYTMVPGGTATFGDTWLKVRVWPGNAPGARDLRLRYNCTVDVLTYRLPISGYAPIPAEPDAQDPPRQAKGARE